jgi:hypothetical protein
MSVGIPRRLLAGAAIALAVSIAPDLVAQNFASNSNFDTATTGWTFAGTGSSAFSSLDVAGSVSSGSALLTNAGAIEAVYVAQCVSGIVGGNLYDIGASVRIPSGGAVGNAYVAYFFYDGALCTGGNSGNFTPAVSTVNTWTVTSNTNVAAPVTAVSVLLQLTLSKTAAPGQIQANFDRAFVGPPGTTPVSLLRFEVE